MSNPTSNPGSAGAAPKRTSSSQSTQGRMARNNSASGAATTGRAAPPTSHIESTITRLLVTTRQLLEGLTRWSRGEMSENDISNVYVKLGNDFNVACAAFGREEISMSNLLHFPTDLRSCLEACLSEPSAPRALDLYLPKVRQIIVALLGGLQEKQVIYRELIVSRRAREARDKEMRDKETRDKETREREFALAAAAGPALTPISASQSRDDLQKFVDQSRASGAVENGGVTNRNSTSRQTPSAQSSGSIPQPTRYSSSGTLGSPIESSSRPASAAGQRVSSSNPRSAEYAAPRRTVSADEGSSTMLLPSATLAASKSLSGVRSNRDDSNRSSLNDDAGSSQSSGSVTTLIGNSAKTSEESARLSNLAAPPLQPIPAMTNSTNQSTVRPQLDLGELTPFTLADPTAATPTLDDPFTPSTERSRAQIESMETLKASDNLTRRASKRFSIITHRNILGTGSDPRGSPGSGGSSGAGRELSHASGGGGGTPEGARGATSSSTGHSRRKGELRSMRSDGAETRTPPRPSAAFASGNMSTSHSTSSIISRAPTILEEDSGSEGEERPQPTRRTGHGSAAHGGLDRSPAMIVSSRSSYMSASSSTTQHDGQSPPPPTDVNPTTGPSRSRVNSSISVTTTDEAPEFPLSIYLQLERNVKKVRLDEAPTIAALRVLFIERFQYNPGLDDFPAIYLRDPIVGVQYELEDLSEVRQGSILSLNIDSVEQVKHHIDQGLSSLAQDIKELRTTMTAMRRASVTQPALGPSHTSPHLAQSPPLARPSERQFQDVAQKVHNATSPSSTSPSTLSPVDAPVVNTTTVGLTSTKSIISVLKTQHEEVQNLRREIGVLRQVYLDFVGQTKSMLSDLRTQTSHVQNLAATKISTSRAFIDAGKTKLDTETTDLIVKGDDLQDAIDQMRADISIKKIRPRPGQIQDIADTMELVNKTRSNLISWIAGVKPSWKATWSDELQRIISEQQMLEGQEIMLGELETDLQEAASIFSTIQKVAQQSSASTLSAAGKTPTRMLKEFIPPTVDDHQGLQTVLHEVRGLQPDADRRLLAIAESERRREEENANRTDDFTNELGGFVAGGKLKKSGGVEEAERLRQARSEATLKAMFAN